MIKDNYASNRKVNVCFTAEPELIVYLNKMAAKDHCSVSQYLRNLLWSGYELEKTIEEEEDLPEGVKRLADGRLVF